MTDSCWRHRLQCIVIVRSFSEVAKTMLAMVCKLDLSKGGGSSSVC